MQNRRFVRDYDALPQRHEQLYTECRGMDRSVESGDLGAGTGRVRAAGQGAGRRVHRARHRGQEIAAACGQLAAEG